MLVTTCGILVADIVAAGLQAIAAPGEFICAPRGIHVGIGGHPANVSVDLVKLGLARGEVSLAGCVGVDVLGTFIADVLREYGVEAHLQVISNVGTSKDMVLVVKGEDRRYHAEVGANLHLDPALVKARLREEKPLLFYVRATGLLGHFDDELAKTLEEARGLGCLVLVDVVEPYRKNRDFLLPALPWIDLLHCNIDEARSFTERATCTKRPTALSRRGSVPRS